MEWVQKNFWELGKSPPTAGSLYKEWILRVRNVMLLDYKGLTGASVSFYYRIYPTDSALYLAIRPFSTA